MNHKDGFIEKILERSPSSETLLVILSLIKETEDLKNVIRICRRALEIYPGNTGIRKILAEAYMADGRILNAELELKKVVTEIEELMSVYLLQASVFERQKRDDEAIEALKKFLAHCPLNKEAEDLMALLSSRKQGDSPEAPEPGMKEAEVYKIATPTLAETWFNQGRMEEAAEIYDKILLNNPDDQKSRQRLEEILALMAAAGQQETRREEIKHKTGRVISVLESWLESIRDKTGQGLFL